MQSSWFHSLCHNATAIDMQQSKIQCHSHHTPLRFFAQPIIDTIICYVWLFDHFPNTKEEEKEFVQSYICFFSFPFLSFLPLEVTFCMYFISLFREWANIHSERILWRNPENFRELWLLLSSPRPHFLPLCQIQATLSGSCTHKEEEPFHLCTWPQNTVLWSDLYICIGRKRRTFLSEPKSILCSFPVCLRVVWIKKQKHLPRSPSKVAPLRAGSSWQGKHASHRESFASFWNCCWFPRSRNQRPPLFIESWCFLTYLKSGVMHNEFGGK